MPFGLFDRVKNKQKELTSSERQMLELLTAGDVPEFARLRAQWGEPFGMWIERRPLGEVRYSVDLIHDGNTVDEHSIGDTLQFTIDALVIIDCRIPTPLSCIGPVSDGILSNIICVAPQPERWPRYLNVDDWFYLDVNGQQSKTRTRDWRSRIVAAHVPVRIDPEIDALIPIDYREYVSRRGWQREVEDITLLRARDLYFLDDTRVRGRFLVFGSLSDASVMAFRVAESDAVDGVYYVRVDDGEAERVW